MLYPVDCFLSTHTTQVIPEGDILVSLGRGSKLTAFIPVKVPSPVQRRIRGVTGVCNCLSIIRGQPVLKCWRVGVGLPSLGQNIAVGIVGDDRFRAILVFPGQLAQVVVGIVGDSFIFIAVYDFRDPLFSVVHVADGPSICIGDGIHQTGSRLRLYLFVGSVLRRNLSGQIGILPGQKAHAEFQLI